MPKNQQDLYPDFARTSPPILKEKKAEFTNINKALKFSTFQLKWIPSTILIALFIMRGNLPKKFAKAKQSAIDILNLEAVIRKFSCTVNNKTGLLNLDYLRDWNLVLLFNSPIFTRIAYQIIVMF
nr:11277_t:CDS:2 [Entrophospora candida]